jgi:alpha-L-arabinofuranosidase
MKRLRIVFLSTLIATAAQLAAGRDAVKITLHPDRHASYSIPRTLFGSFLEPIGNSTYNGLWAEVLQNPSFEENLWSAAALAQMIQEEPALRNASKVGLPLPWEPLDPSEGDRYEPRWGDAANSWRSLAIFGLPDKETGVRQKVYLPIHRELEYDGSIYVKHLSGPDNLEISIRRRNHPEQTLGSAKVTAGSSQWQKYPFVLKLSTAAVEPGEPVDFVIQVQGDERTIIDQASLTPADAVDGLDPEMLELAKQMKTPLVRFGGNFTSGYHWRDGVGPRDKRVSMLNIAWGMPEYNQFGTDEFLRFCELIGAQPQIALNLGSGTPREAADWVRYVDEHWPIHSGLLWELGNELWNKDNVGYPTLSELPHRTVEFANAIHRVDPTARLIATGEDPDRYHDWNAAQLTDPAGTFNFLSTHFVVTTTRTKDHSTDPDELARDAFALPVELGRRLQAMQGQIDESSHFKDKAHIAFTEWLFAAGSPDAPKYDNMGGAIAAGGFFNMLLQNANAVSISDMTGIIEFAGIWKKHSVVYAAPSYYAFRMYSTADIKTPIAVDNTSGTYDVHGGITRLPDIANVPYLDVVAALNQAGDKLTIFCINRHLTDDIPADIDLNGFGAIQPASVQTLRAASIYDVNDQLRPHAIVPADSTAEVAQSHIHFTFPHESITRIELHSGRIQP